MEILENAFHLVILPEMAGKLWLRILVFVGLILNAISNLSAQGIFQLYFSPLNALAIDANGLLVNSIGINALAGKYGAEIEFLATRESRLGKFILLNPQLKYLFSKKKGSEVSKYRYITLGFNYLNMSKDSYVGRSKQFQPPYWDSTLPALTYATYNLNTLHTSNYMQVGYEKVTEIHYSVDGWSIVKIVDPFGRVLGSYESKGKGADFNYTRTFRLSLFATTPTMMEHKIKQAFRSETLIKFNDVDEIVMEPTPKNLFGLRMGLLWTSLGIIGTTFGIEMSLVPGDFSRFGVYGRNFPDDNIIIRANFGLSFGNSWDYQPLEDQE